jgi:hypothetical protein
MSILRSKNTFYNSLTYIKIFLVSMGCYLWRVILHTLKVDTTFKSKKLIYKSVMIFDVDIGLYIGVVFTLLLVIFRSQR